MSSHNDATFPFTFADMLCGIGGMRIGLQEAGGRCVFSCERDKNARKTYKTWFGEEPHGDVWDINPKDIPDHDILVSGFPCQPFSIAGIPKKNSLGMAHGFDDKDQGNLFFRLADIVSVKRPLAMIFENVKNLLSHDKRRTWATIESTLTNMEYTVFHKTIDADTYVPQHRERVFVVCFDKRVFSDASSFEFPNQFPDVHHPRPAMASILENEVPDKYTLSDSLWAYLQKHAERQKAKGNNFRYGLVDKEGVSRTLSARYFKDGSEILVPQTGKNPRFLTPRECARLMGFPDELPIVVSDDQAYKQFGNSLVPQVSSAIAKNVTSVFRRRIEALGLTGFARTVCRSRNKSRKTVRANVCELFA